MYIELDTDYFDHPRVIMLRRLIGEGADVYPLRMWTWAARHAREGVLAPDLVEAACRWAGDMGVLLNALEQVGLLTRQEDGRFFIKGWDKWSGKFFQQYERKLERMRDYSKERRGVQRVEVRAEKKAEPEEGKEVPFKSAKKAKKYSAVVEGVTNKIVEIWNEGRPAESRIRVTEKRLSKVSARLGDSPPFTPEQICDIARRLKVSPHHNGRNDRGWHAPGPEWALESTERAEQWVNGQGRRPAPMPSARCGVCGDSGQVPVGVGENRTVLMGPCTSCQRREQA